jgi:hypothetical protein
MAESLFVFETAFTRSAGSQKAAATPALGPKFWTGVQLALVVGVTMLVRDASGQERFAQLSSS